MSAELLISLSQENVKRPYKFNMTGVCVYSLEEALYHTYYYWKESIEEFLCDEFLLWVKNELKLGSYVSKLEAIKEIDGTSNQLLGFLTITEYFDSQELNELKKELSKWEKQLEWEKLKDMADHFMKKKQPEKAYTYYRKALNYGENVSLLNNTGIALMHLEMYPEASEYLYKAYQLDKDNEKVLLNLCEALIFVKDFDNAFKYLKKVERSGEKAHVYYLYALMCMDNKNYRQACDYLLNACELEYDSLYYYKLCDCYILLEDYKNAVKALSKINERGRTWYIKKAEVYRARGDINEAITSIEKAISEQGLKDLKLWVTLARYNREKGDFDKAEKACKKALAIDPEDNIANLEYAKINSMQGKSRDYSNILGNILNNFKKEYRKIIDY